MRIWFDVTAPAHPVVFRPVIERLKAGGHEVLVTARDYAQTLPLLERMGIEHTAIGAHGGASRARKLSALVGRTRRMRAVGRSGHFDLAVGHGSNDLALAAASLRIPAVNTFDYEFATVQHHVGCRLARRVMVPEAVPPERLARFGVDSSRLLRYPGLKEEYYLYDFEPDPGVLDELGIDPERVIVVLRPPPDVSLYHRKANQLFPAVLAALGRREDVHAVVVPRTAHQRAYVRSLDFPSLIVPAGAVDAQSLIAQADLVVSAGGTMNREAVALGTPVYTIYGGRLGGVDEQLIREGKLRPLTDPRGIDVVQHRGDGRERARRDPQFLVDGILGDARMTVTPSRPAEPTIVDQYRAMAHSFERRPVDSALRALDVTLAGVMLLALSPIMALAACLVQCTGGPVLYRGARVGRAGVVFTMLKFRTLRVGSELRLGPYAGAELTALTAAEVTRIGRILRATKVDELPQLVNVLRGDMSLVGPRPIRPPFFEELCHSIPGYWQRLVVPPGLTGLAQLRMSRSMSWSEKLAHDVEWIADRSVRLYLVVLVETAVRLLGGDWG